MYPPCWRICRRQPRHPLSLPILLLGFLSIVWGALPVSAIPPAPHPRIASSVLAAAQHVEQPPTATSQATSVAQPGRLEIYVYIPGLTSQHLAILHTHGVQVLHSQAPAGIVYAALSPDRLEAVALLPFVRWIGTPAYATRRRVTSAGDTVLRADQARHLGVTGRGVRIGIISDSLTEIRQGIASGDLPAAGVNIVKGRDGASLPGATNEGRALAEIIHDLAPQAELFFHSGFPTSMQMLEAIDALSAEGVDIIVDDLAFFDEPVFEDGLIAQAVQKAIVNGILYVTAAGNSAMEHYLAPYQGIPGEREELHDFGQGNTMLDVRVSSNITVFLQWPNLADGSANSADYDMFLVNSEGTSIGSSVDRQIGGQAPPRETIFLPLTNSTSRTVRIIIKRIAGEALPLSLYFIGELTLPEHNVPSQSMFGHPCVRGALAVGAIPANLPFGFDALEAFSSRGPCEILLPQRDVRTKPDVIATDRVLTSLPRFAPFVGTSAAAPHVAAIAALMLEASRQSGTVSPTHIANTLRVTAIDGGPEGVDHSFGHGVVDALQAVEAIQAFGTGANTPPRSIIDDPADDRVVAPQALVTFQGTCMDAEDQQPTRAVWHFAGAAPDATGLRPEPIAFATVGTFLVTLTCTDATGLTDPTPATRRIIVNTPPDSRITSPTADVTTPVGSTIRFQGTCADSDGDQSVTFLWDFGGGANLLTSTQRQPAATFQQPGTFRVTLTCRDARGTPDPTPALVLVTVPADANTSGDGNGGSSGGGCALLPSSLRPYAHPYDALLTALLPLLLIGLLRLWSQRTPQR